MAADRDTREGAIRRWLLRANCWWAGHEPRSTTWVGPEFEEGTCRYCGIEIRRAIEPKVTT